MGVGVWILLRLGPPSGSSPKDNSRGVANVHLRVRCLGTELGSMTQQDVHLVFRGPCHCAKSFYRQDPHRSSLILREGELWEGRACSSVYPWGSCQEPCQPPHINQKNTPWQWPFLLGSFSEEVAVVVGRMSRSLSDRRFLFPVVGQGTLVHAYIASVLRQAPLSGKMEHVSKKGGK